MRVRSRIDVAGGEATIGRTAYRVVQEGLTNARKHAPAAAVDVSVTAPNGALVVEVRSRPSTAAPASLPGAGTGLIGLAERVSLAGGELAHGREADGDLQVEVRSLAPVAVAAVSPPPGAGTGLIGLTERVALAGGELEHGIDADGAFVVRARLPR